MRIEIVIALSMAGAAVITLIVRRLFNVRPRRPEGFWNYLGYEQPNKASEIFWPKFLGDSETRRFNRVTATSFLLGVLLSLAIVLSLMYLFDLAVLT